MASQSDIDRRKAILRARGVPERFVDALARRRGPIVKRCLMALIAAAPIAAFTAAFNFNEINAWLTPMLYTSRADSLLFSADNDPATGVIAALLGLGTPAAIWLYHVVRLLRPGPFPTYSGIADVLRHLSPGERLDRIKPWARYTVLADLPDDQAFLNVLHLPRFWSWPSVLFQLILAAVMAFTLWKGVIPAFTPGPYWEATLDTLEVHADGRTVTRRFADAQYAYVICYSSHTTFDFRLHFPDRPVSLWKASDPMHRLDREQVVERLAQIDNRLAQLHVRVDRMPATGRFHDDAVACVNQMSDRWSPEGRKALQRLVFGN
jgi:hypothetical protein